MKRTFLLTFLSCIFFTQVVLAQSEKEKIQQIEIQKQIDKQRKLNVKLDSAVRLLEEGQYEEADKKFTIVLKSIRSVPTDFTYHFGKNSYFLGKNKQSVDWLTKYVQLKGTSGQYSEAAVEWLAKAEAALLVEKEQEAKVASQVLSKDFTIDCGGTGKVVCTVCKGSTVVIKKSYFGDTYTTCGYCHKLGYLTCDEYNHLLRGELKPSN